MTDAQCEPVETQEKLIYGLATLSAKLEGSHQDKSKGLDLRNWGNASLLEEDLEAETQHQILEDCKMH